MPSSATLCLVRVRRKVPWLAFCLLIVPLAAGAQTTEALPGTEPLTWEGDLSARMVAGIDTFLMGELDRSVVERQKLWKRDFSSRAAYEKSVEQNRQRFQKYIGVVDPRLPVKAFEYVTSTAALPLVAETDSFRVYAVRWPVFHDVQGEGLLLQPKSELRARVVAVPDADQTPEMLVGLAPGLAPESQFARRLAENRNVFGLLQEFGDAEIAGLIAPRNLTVEFSEVPKIDGPPKAREGRGGAAPGGLSTPARFEVEAEIERTRGLLPKPFPFPLEFIHGPEGTTVGPISGMALTVFLKALGVDRPPSPAAARMLIDRRTGFDPAATTASWIG